MYPRINDAYKYNAALYLRLSKEDDKKGGKHCESDSESIVNQRAMLEDYAKQQQIGSYAIYVDDGVSGTTFERDDWKRMIADIEAGEINMVITKDMSRLGRDYIETGHYMERYFPENRVRYISLLDGIDTGVESTSNDISPFRAIMNDMYAKDISKKITAVKRDKQDKGLFIGGKAAYGYMKHPTQRNMIIIDEPAAENVEYIFRLALEGKSCREIAKMLNLTGVPTPATYAGINLNPNRKGPYSGLWSAERISFMLQNEVYIGNMVQGRMKKVSYKSKKSLKLPQENWKVIEGTHEPIVDEETFTKVGQLIKSRERTRQRTHDFLLKGIIYCHECGKPLGVNMRTMADKRQILSFACRTYQRFTTNSACTLHYIGVDTVTDAVLTKVKEICKRYVSLLDLGQITDEVNGRMLAQQKRRQNSASNIKANLEALKSKIDRVYIDRLSDKIDEEDYQRIYSKLKAEQGSLQSKLDAADDSDNGGLLDHRKVKDLVDRFLEAEGGSRELIVSLIERIEMTEAKELIIHFKFKELEMAEELR